MDNKKFKKLLKETGIFKGGPKVVTIGGGTGLSTLLRGLKRYTANITAIVTVFDDGGGSGMLREEIGMLPPGDIRNCITALANTEPVMEQLMQYRFKEGHLKGQSFGNLFIAALNEIYGSFDEAIRQISNVLAVTGTVLPVTLENVVLYAELEDGTVIKGESQIPTRQQTANAKIKRVFIRPSNCKALPEALEAIQNADAVILGPGSLYTSIIPNLLVKDITKAIHNTDALKIYVSNIMTQQGETIGYTLSDHIHAIRSQADKIDIDYAIASSGYIPDYIQEKYRAENAEPVQLDYHAISKMGIRVVEGDFADIQNDFIRHNFNALAGCIFELICDEKLFNDKKRILDYYYINGKLKKYKP